MISTGTEAAPVLPARSVATPETRLTPSVRATVSVIRQKPPVSTRPLPIKTPPRLSFTVLPASAVPRNSGRLCATTSASKVGASGAVASIMRTLAKEKLLALPAASIAKAAIRCEPSVRAFTGVNVQSPVAETTTLPRRVAPS